MSARWVRCGPDDLPDRFGPECDNFRTRCSNGFVGSLSIGSAFLHKPELWPQCFPNGPDGDCTCEIYTERRA